MGMSGGLRDGEVPELRCPQIRNWELGGHQNSRPRKGVGGGGRGGQGVMIEMTNKNEHNYLRVPCHQTIDLSDKLIEAILSHPS